MPTITQTTLEPRKTPLQSRSTATVEAIFEATIQVLLRDGYDRLTTTRVAERAGVSVGTLYQYYPNKQSLLRAILAQHLEHVTSAVEAVCRAHHDQPVAIMVQHLIDTFVQAKMRHKDASSAFYAVASQLNSESLSVDFRRRCHTAIMDMLRTTTDVRIHELDFTVTMLVSTMTGTIRAVLESGASRKKVEDLRRHLVVLATSYLTSAAA